jgi:hypothetical protein
MAGSMAYVTPSVTAAEGAVGTTALDGIAAQQAANGYVATGGETALNNIAAQQSAMGYLKGGAKAASTYNAVSSAGQPPPMAPPAPQPIFQGEAPPIAQQQEQGSDHEFTRMLLEKRNRGMLG